MVVFLGFLGHPYAIIKKPNGEDGSPACAKYKTPRAPSHKRNGWGRYVKFSEGARAVPGHLGPGGLADAPKPQFNFTESCEHGWRLVRGGATGNRPQLAKDSKGIPLELLSANILFFLFCFWEPVTPLLFY